MDEPRIRRDTPEQYDETTDPRNPPNSVLSPNVRSATTWSVFLPLVVLTIVAGLLWVFWLGQPPHRRDAKDIGPGTSAVGTSGKKTPGGFNPDPKPDNTQDEIEFRGGKK